MMALVFAKALSICLLYANLINAQINASIVGTWTTKSAKVLTGPGFYNPLTEKFFEPNLTGISYSFTADGQYEESYYRAVSNPINPRCPSGIIQWQHGTFTSTVNNSLILKPIAVDGRQLLSQPCNYDTSILTRWSQPELILSWVVYTDTYKNQPRLDMLQWDGTPYNPMWLAYDPPQMLPTTTLNPTGKTTKAPRATDTATATATATPAVKFEKRHVGEAAEPKTFAMHEKLLRKNSKTPLKLYADWWFWAGLAMTGLGGVLFMVS